MFKHNHYVPVLRWKRAEWIAFRDLEASYRKNMTPLIELPPKNFVSPTRKTVKDSIKQISQDLALSCKNLPFFFDLGLFSLRDQSKFVEDILLKLGEKNKNLIPVTSIKRSPIFQEAICCLATHNKRGICLRIEKDELGNVDFAKIVNAFLAQIEISSEEIDLIVDFKIIDNSCPSFAYVTKRIPLLSRWRSFTIISGFFPKYLTEFEPGQHLHPRSDWRNWVQQVSNKLHRKPSFGDYTIQHPIYEEPPERPNVSASIRYTSTLDWVIMRGESLKKMGYDQYTANALMLCEREEFCGPDFSTGDRYIYERGTRRDTTGNPETWLRAGINHHLTFVVHQLSNLIDF